MVTFSLCLLLISLVVRDTVLKIYDSREEIKNMQSLVISLSEQTDDLSNRLTRAESQINSLVGYK